MATIDAEFVRKFRKALAALRRKKRKLYKKPPTK